jgi:hypothetical protein
MTDVSVISLAATLPPPPMNLVLRVQEGGNLWTYAMDNLEVMEWDMTSKGFNPLCRWLEPSNEHWWPIPHGYMHGRLETRHYNISGHLRGFGMVKQKISMNWWTCNPMRDFGDTP